MESSQGRRILEWIANDPIVLIVGRQQVRSAFCLRREVRATPSVTLQCE